MSSTFTITTSAADTPAAFAIATLNCVCLSAVNDSLVSGIETAILTTNTNTDAGEGVGEGEVTSSLVLEAGASESDVEEASGFKHSCMPILPAGDMVPSSHASHSVEPLTALYFPMAQGVQTEPDASLAAKYPVNPALQIQSETAPLPAGASEFAGQAKHVRPVPAEYLPTAQLLHAWSPTCSLNFPRGHCVHSPEFL